MAGIYFHIPFCKQACSYCDFHFSTNLSYKNRMLEAMKMELSQRKSELGASTVESIYFGGGTPSLVAIDDIKSLIDICLQEFHMATTPEITLEANPDDINIASIRDWQAVGVNRLSVGVQSFDSNDLLWMKRAHNVEQAMSALHAIQSSGIASSVDLIYGLPSGDEVWKLNLNQLIAFHPEHISAYCLTVEEKTALNTWIEKGTITLPNDEQQAAQFKTLVSTLKAAGYEQYEISNFCRDQHYAQHNSNYWKGKAYLGIGPSAHSFDGQKRQWNIANNPQYMSGIEQHLPIFEEEVLSFRDQFNERIMTGLRTKWGVDVNELSRLYSVSEQFYQTVKAFERRGLLQLKNQQITLTENGKLLADYVAAELFEANVDQA
jgi:oxygen-independent coproporphyrinogen III oxidase